MTIANGARVFQPVLTCEGRVGKPVLHSANKISKKIPMKIHRLFLLPAFALLLAGCATQREWFPPDPEAGRQIARWVATSAEENPHGGFKCLVYLPTYYSSQNEKQKWPLLFYLHGSPDCGDDVDKIKRGGIARLLAQPVSRKDWPFITVSPLSPAGWFKPAELSALLDALEREYNVDTERIYVTGLSMGGFGTWAWAAHEPQRFAAVAPVAGRGDPSQAARLVDLPVWAFHGDADGNVKPSGSINMVEAIKKAGGTKAKLTLYPGVGHNSWDRTYGDPAFYKWLLSNTRKKTE